jgi:hypothetical protein
LREVGPWDALWLAEVLLTVAERTLRCDAEEVLMVLPDEPEEPSGARPVGRALEDRLAVAVTFVPRRVLVGKEQASAAVSKRIRDYASHNIVVVDESTVTYRTLKLLEDFVVRIAKRKPALAMTIIEATGVSVASRPESLVSLNQWTPLQLAGHVPGGGVGDGHRVGLVDCST